MHLNIKQKVLDKIYAVYEDFAQTIDVACKPGCSACCTQNVTATANEVFRVYNHLKTRKNLDWKTQIKGYSKQTRFRPEISTNKLAELCMIGKEIPPEENHLVQEPCPFLEDELCTIYTERPFGCRCFVSRQNCRKSDCADVDPFVLTVNTVFLQFLEHIDTPGFTGNFMDVLTFFTEDGNTNAYENNHIQFSGTSLIPNRSISTLLVPPEHRDRIRWILSALQGIQIPNN